LEFVEAVRESSSPLFLCTSIPVYRRIDLEDSPNRARIFIGFAA
jgi:hypothetical protein